jgi:hypothetical protein
VEQLWLNRAQDRRHPTCCVSFAAQDRKKQGGAPAGGTKAAACTSIADPDGAAAAAAAPDPNTAINGVNLALVPHFLVQLDAPRDELLRRVKALAAAEEASAAAGKAVSSAQAAGAKAAQPPPKKLPGGGARESLTAIDADAAPTSHNNERDLARRYDAWRAVVAEDAADLAARVGPSLRARCVRLIVFC